MLLVGAGGQLHGNHRQAAIPEGSQDVGVAWRNHHCLDGHMQWNVKDGLQPENYKINRSLISKNS